MKNIVCFGGGNAMPNAVLSELKHLPDVEIFSVSSMSDSGGSAGEERMSSGTPVAYGDIRRAAYQLSSAPFHLRDFLNKRLETNEDIEKAIEMFPEIKDSPYLSKGHVLANIIATTTDVSSGTIKAVKKLEETYKIPEGRLLPVTELDLTLVAELENGKRVEGEGNIDKGICGNSKIEKVRWNRDSEIYRGTKEAMEGADFIIIGPGDLYSSLAQILLVKGVPEAVKKSKAKKIYICNLMQKRGETAGFGVLNFTNEIEKYLGSKLDFVIYNKTLPPEERLEDYKKEHPELIDMVSFKNLSNNEKFIGEDVLASSGPIIHDSKKLIRVIQKLCKL